MYDESTGQVQVESKKHLKSRGGHSPDKADCVMMFHYLDNRIFGEQAKRRSKWKKVDTSPPRKLTFMGV
jgi:hypothetical protein